MRVLVKVILFLAITCELLPQAACYKNQIRTDPQNPANTEYPSKINRDPQGHPIFDWVNPEKYWIKSLLNSDKITNPFFDLVNPSVRTLRENKDMYPKDGWELILKSLGLPVDAPNYNCSLAAQAILNPYNDIVLNPYFILYNKYTGVMRVIVACHHVETGFNAAKIVIKHRNEVFQSSNLDMYKATDEMPLKPLDRFDENPQLVSVAEYMANSDHWFYADFQMFYDPCICNFKSELHVEVYLVTKATITLTGTLDGKIEDLADYEKGKGGKVPTEGNNSFSLDDAIGIGKKAVKSYNDAKGYRDDINKQLDKWKNADKNNNSTIDIEDIKIANTDPLTNTTLSDEEAQEVLEELEGDLPQFNVEERKAETSSFFSELGNSSFLRAGLSYVPYIGGAVGLVQGLFFGGSNPTDKPVKLRPLAINLNANFSGTIQTESKFVDCDFITPGSKLFENGYPVYNSETMQIEYPFYNMPMGVFNLLRLPKAKLYRKKERTCQSYCTNCCDIGDNGDGTGPADMVTTKDKFRIKLESLDYVVNPYAGLKMQMDANIEDIEILGCLKIRHPKLSGYIGLPFKRESKTVISSRTVPVQLLMKYPLDFDFSSTNGPLCGDMWCFNDFLDDIWVDPYFATQRIPKNELPKIFLKLIIKLKRADNQGNPVLIVAEYPVDIEIVNNTVASTWETGTCYYVEEGTVVSHVLNEDIITWGDIHLSDVQPTANVAKAISGKDIKVISSRIIGEKTLSVRNPILCKEPPVPPVSQDALNIFCSNNRELTTSVYSRKRNFNQKVMNCELSKDSKVLISLAPNPTSENVTISAYIPEDQKINVYITNNMSMKILDVMNEDVSQGPFSKSIDIHQFDPGVYYVTLSTIQGVFTEKLVIVR